MGVASKLSGVKGGHAAEVEMVADFRINSSIPLIPVEAITRKSEVKLPTMQHTQHNTEQLSIKIKWKRW